MTDYTPRPWNITVVKRSISWPGLFQLVETGPLTFGWEGEEGIYCDNEADAHLIAAAPDLLEAAREAIDILEYMSNEDWDMHGPTEAQAVLRAGIAKALDGEIPT